MDNLESRPFDLSKGQAQTSRRDFLEKVLFGLSSVALGGKAVGSLAADKAAQGSAGLVASASTPPAGIQPASAATANPPALPLENTPIVDTHLHLWDLKKLRLPWLRQGDPLCRDHLLEEYLREAEGLNIVQAVYMEVDVHDEDLVKEAEYVLDLCQRKGSLLVGAVLGGRPGTPQFASSIRRFKDSPWVKGVRRIPRDGNTAVWLEKPFIQDIRLLGELGMCFDLCMPPQKLSDAVKLVDACPGARFVLDHCGNADPLAFASARAKGESESSGEKPPAGSAKVPPPSRAPAHDPEQWRRDIAQLARREQVVCKISGIVARAEKDRWQPKDLAPIVNHCLEVFGPDRVIFASDWPVCTRTARLRQWVLALKEIVRDRSDVDNGKLFCQNAVRFYRLPAPT